MQLQGAARHACFLGLAVPCSRANMFSRGLHRIIVSTCTSYMHGSRTRLWDLCFSWVALVATARRRGIWRRWTLSHE